MPHHVEARAMHCESLACCPTSSPGLIALSGTAYRRMRREAPYAANLRAVWMRILLGHSLTLLIKHYEISCAFVSAAAWQSRQ